MINRTNLIANLAAYGMAHAINVSQKAVLGNLDSQATTIFFCLFVLFVFICLFVCLF